MYYTNKGMFFDIFEYKEYNFCKVYNISFMFLQIDDCKGNLHFGFIITYRYKKDIYEER